MPFDVVAGSQPLPSGGGKPSKRPRNGRPGHGGVVGRDHDQRVVEQPAHLQRVHDPADLVVRVLRGERQV
jgi:hypothetical protein